MQWALKPATEASLRGRNRRAIAPHPITDVMNQFTNRAEAFKRGIPLANGRFFGTGHFALETHAREIVESIGDFFKCKSRYTDAGENF
jgi:hypothetical protein